MLLHCQMYPAGPCDCAHESSRRVRTGFETCVVRRRSVRHLVCDQIPERWARDGGLAARVVPALAVRCAAQVRECQSMIMTCVIALLRSSSAGQEGRAEVKPTRCEAGYQTAAWSSALQDCRFRSTMSYYHEARQAKVQSSRGFLPSRLHVAWQTCRLLRHASQADLKTASLDNKRKAERRAELVTTQACTVADHSCVKPAPPPPHAPPVPSGRSRSETKISLCT